ncbi:methyl-accepting chemotaxis protein, partial [Azospirillum rugosum]
LGGIVSGVQQVAGLIAEMAAASSEQASALDEINATVSQMDEMTQKNAALVEETTAAAQSLASQAGDLRALVGFFKLDTVAVEAAPAPATPTLRRAIAPTRPPVHTSPARRSAGAALQRAAADEDDWKEF